MSQLTQLLELLSYITVLSITVERLVEVFKPIIDSGFAKTLYKTTKGRSSIIYLLSFSGGVWLHTMSNTVIPYFTDPVGAALIAGLLASGGSGVWHDLLGVLKDYNTSVASTTTTVK